MKVSKLSISLLLIVMFTSYQNIYPQLPRDSWSFGFGGTYPRIVSLWEGAWAGRDNYGGFLLLQRNFSEYVALRLTGGYNYMETKKVAGGTHSINLFNADIDMLYYLVPCETLSPYMLVGFGGIFFYNRNSPEPTLDVNYLQFQANLGVGAEWKFSDNWSFTAEGVYHTASNNKLDGYDDPGADKGLFGGNSDTYIRLNAGFKFYFSKGEPSQICDLYPGVIECPSIEEIEEAVKKHIPEEVVKEVIIEKPVEHKVKESRWTLVGVNFEFNKAELLPESYTILFYAVQYLNENPDIKVEIEGHTDSKGSEIYNQNLSERRAKTVRDYLISKGIDPSRLTYKGYGESMPVADNNTPEGRALNRRIDFKIIE